ncbi:NACHT domain-containing protein [Streptomyces sp. NPDC048172]|uniref:NACHT domain-containing protein n=1 Tax=Streptomyces sp. NPDC048172 TaxID=3365505 RepID=UPI003719E989
MDAGVVGARLASSVVGPLVKKLFVSEGPGAGLVDRPVRVSGLVSFRGEKRTLTAKDLRKIAEELVRRAARDIGTHEAPGPEARQRVAGRIAWTLDALGETGLTDVDAVSMGHAAFARALHDQATIGRTSLAVEQDETAFYFRVLETACLHVLHFFTQRSTFVARTLAAQSQQLRDLVTLVDVLIERVPSQSAQDAAFERQYAQHIAKRHSSLTIYGIDLHHAREWPLDTAYLSLEATATAAAPETPDERNAHTDQQPVEQALSGHRRVLLRGIAGSGKTTLVQWLAVTTARQDTLTGRLSHLIGRVPYVLPLRTLTRAGARLPVPADFLAAVSSPLCGSQPPGWTDRVLAAGRGVLLVDGIDEVPESERERTRRWLRDLLTAFPDNLFLVTSRPSAVREDWLGTDDFTELSLSSMRPADVEVFIRRWHEAAEAEPELGDALLSSVRSKPDLGRLATNPLMCGLICALHRERRGFLPRGRKALYDAALSMLLERRDRERDMHRPDGIEMDEESQVELLQRLAYWLIRNGRSEMAHDDALALLERVLPSMRYVASQGTPEELFQHLLVRSGLLREPGHGTVEFVHRTFQDYLGAKAAVEERDFDVLVQHAHLDQWEDVLRMAVAHARPHERARLLHALVDRGDNEPACRTRLHLLAMACLEHATNLDPAVREAVEERARMLLPPRSGEEAQELARVGPVVLELLPGPDGLMNDEVSATVQTAGEIGGDAALLLLVRFREHPEATMLGRYWDRFDTDAYAREIVPYLDRGFVTVRTDEEIARLREAGGHPYVELVGDLAEERIAQVLEEGQVRKLLLTDNDRLSNLSFLRDFPSIEELDLRRCPHVIDLAPLRAVRELWLWDFGTQGMRGLRELNQLKRLVLRGDTVWPGFQSLPPPGSLEGLLFPRRGLTSLDGLTEYQELTEVSFWGVEHRLAQADWEEMHRLPGLIQLVLDHPQLSSLPDGFPEFPGVTLLQLQDSAPGDLERACRLFPKVRTLAVHQPAGDVDLSPLSTLPELSTVHVNRAERIINADRLAENVDLNIYPRPRTNPTP